MEGWKKRWSGSGCQRVRCAVESVRERGSIEAKEVRVTRALFADDATIVRTKMDMDESVKKSDGQMGGEEQ